MKLIEANTKTINNITAILSGNERSNEAKTNTCANCGRDVGNIFNVNNGHKFCHKACENIYEATRGIQAPSAVQEVQIPLALRL